MNFTKYFIKFMLISSSVFVINVSMADEIITTNNHCKISNLYPEPNETATWSGKCLEGYAEGNGTVNWYKDGKPTGTFIGKYIHGKMNGFGTFTWGKGDKYEGEFKDSYRQGQGTLIWADGVQYVGEFVKNKRQGNGKYIYKRDNKEILEWQKYNIGHYVGNDYVVEGIFENGDLIKLKRY